MEKKPIVFMGKTEYFFCCPVCEKELEDKKIEEKRHREFLMIHEEIPPKFYTAELKDFPETSIKPVLEWVSVPKGFLFITGVCGCGKTRLICAIKKHFNINHIRAHLEFSSDLFLELRDSFSNDKNSEAYIITSLGGEADALNQRLNIVLFDDIGAQKISEYVLEAWYAIIDLRYRNDLPTIFTSNLNLSEISTRMSDRIASRIASGKVFELKGQDRRLIR